MLQVRPRRWYSALVYRRPAICLAPNWPKIVVPRLIKETKRNNHSGGWGSILSPLFLRLFFFQLSNSTSNCSTSISYQCWFLSVDCFCSPTTVIRRLDCGFDQIQNAPSHICFFGKKQTNQRNEADSWIAIHHSCIFFAHRKPLHAGVVFRQLRSLKIFFFEHHTNVWRVIQWCEEKLKIFSCEHFAKQMCNLCCIFSASIPVYLVMNRSPGYLCLLAHADN